MPLQQSALQYTSYKPNPFNKFSSFSSFICPSSHNYNNNLYYQQKINNDHRLQLKLLKKPGFLIKQEKMYPEVEIDIQRKIQQLLGQNEEINNQKINNDSYHKRTSKNVFDKDIKNVSQYNKNNNKVNKLYTDNSQHQRITIQGTNPFLSQQNLINSTNSKINILKKSSRSSKMLQRSNLGVESYEQLNYSSSLLRNQQKQYQNLNKNNKYTNKYNTKQTNKYGITNNVNVKNKPINPFQIDNKILEQSSDEDMFIERKQQYQFGNKIKNNKNGYSEQDTPFEGDYLHRLKFTNSVYTNKNKLNVKSNQQMPNTIKVRNKMYSRIF